MPDNHILPDFFSTTVGKYTMNTVIRDLAPITFGYEDNVSALRGLVLISFGTRGSYEVPLGCPFKRYKTSCGRRSTLVSNSVILMYPDVPYYVKNENQRKPDDGQIGFLC